MPSVRQVGHFFCATCRFDRPAHLLDMRRSTNKSKRCLDCSTRAAHADKAIRESALTGCGNHHCPLSKGCAKSVAAIGLAAFQAVVMLAPRRGDDGAVMCASFKPAAR